MDVQPEAAWEEFGIEHADGRVSVSVTGVAWSSRMQAENAAAALDVACDWCAGSTHEVRAGSVVVSPWYAPKPLRELPPESDR